MHIRNVAAGLLAAAVLPLVFPACVPDPAVAPPSAFDLVPPALMGAGPEGATTFVLRFDEEVSPVDGSFAVEPGGPVRAEATGKDVVISLPRQVPGDSYSLAGDVQDGRGNSSRVVLAFSGFNDRPAGLRISEVQTGKNSSTKKPHRDFVEFEVASSGNLGGFEFSASSTVKTTAWRFPGIEVAKGDVIVLHCAPEGIPEEIDETGADLGLSGGVDSSPARDLWSKAGGIPDATGVLVVRDSPGGKPLDALFYADGTRSGALGETLAGTLVEELVDKGLWTAGGIPAWEDAFVWKPSVSRSIVRNAPGSGPGAAEWGLSDSGAQSPGTVD